MFISEKVDPPNAFLLIIVVNCDGFILFLVEKGRNFFDNSILQNPEFHFFAFLGEDYLLRSENHFFSN